jgi:glycosyltransferase involved in cell wall biosynthesis
VHICFLTSEYPGYGPTGGIGTSIHALARGLAGLGHKVTVLMYNARENHERCADGVVVRSITTEHSALTGWWTVRRHLRRIINDLVGRDSLDIVEAPDWSGIGAFMHVKCPLVIRCNGSDAYFCAIERRSQKLWNYIQEYAAIHGADGVCAVSRYAADMTEQVFHVDGRVETIVPNAFTAQVPPDIHGTLQASVILHVGTLNRKKGVLELPGIFNHIARKHARVVLRIIGRDAPDPLTGNDSTWRLMMQQFTPEASKRVEYIGPQPHAEIPRHLREASVCLFPSYAEAFPVSWLEAMAAGCPVVTSDTPWAREMFAHGREGFMIDPSQHDIVASRVLSLLYDESLRSMMGRSARQHVEANYNADIIARKTLSFYESVLRQVR